MISHWSRCSGGAQEVLRRCSGGAQEVRRSGGPPNGDRGLEQNDSVSQMCLDVLHERPKLPFRKKKKKKKKKKE
eukprot:1212811-Prymnesium_polylepis.1